MFIHVLEDFDYTPSDIQHTTWAYYAGSLVEVPDDHATAAIAAGKAIEVPAQSPEPNEPEAPVAAPVDAGEPI